MNTRQLRATRRTTLRRRPAKVTLGALACVLLAACGSVVPPSKFPGAGGYGNGNGTNNGSGTNNGAGGSLLPQGSGNGQACATTTPSSSPSKKSTKSPTPSKSASPTNTPAPCTSGSAGGHYVGGSAGSAGGGGSNTGGGGGSNAGGGGGGGGAIGALGVGSCAGFQNTTGITNSAITIANASDVSGPVPGLFESAQQATKAFAAYFNSTSSICGRKLSVENLDSQTSTTGDQQAASSACGSAFAMVGSMGAFDDGGASTISQCGIPDMRATATTGARSAASTEYGTYSLRANYVETAPADYYKSAFPGVASAAAFLYLDAGASSINANSEIAGWKARGFNFVYTAGIPVTEFNYTSYVSAMQQKNVKYVQYVGAYQNAVRLKQAMQQQNFNPVFVMDPTAYDPGFISSGGSAVEGTHVFIGSQTFEDAGGIPEMQLYLQWLHQVAPGAAPSFFGIFAWAAARLFTNEALKLGGQLTRSNLVAQLRGIDSYTGFGMFGPQHVGAKITGSCYGFIVLRNGQWVREGPAPYSCGSVTNTGIS